MLARETARCPAELGLGALLPLDTAIPKFAEPPPKPMAFFLIDLRRAGSMSPDVRATSLGVTKGTNIRGTVIFGASLHLRVAMMLIYKASKLLNKYDDRNPLMFCDTEAQARAWIAEQRAAASR